MGKVWIKETMRKASKTITGQKCLCKGKKIEMCSLKFLLILWISEENCTT